MLLYYGHIWALEGALAFLVLHGLPSQPRSGHGGLSGSSEAVCVVSFCRIGALAGSLELQRPSANKLLHISALEGALALLGLCVLP